MLPKDFPPWQTVYHWFARLCDGCVFERMNHALVMADRQRAGREASPRAFSDHSGSYPHALK